MTEPSASARAAEQLYVQHCMGNVVLAAMEGHARARCVREQGARSSGVNFAIGVDIVRACVPRLIVYGSSVGVGAPLGEPLRTA